MSASPTRGHLREAAELDVGLRLIIAEPWCAPQSLTQPSGNGWIGMPWSVSAIPSS